MNKSIRKAFLGLCLVTLVLSIGFISLYWNESVLLKGITTSSQGNKKGDAVSTLVLNGKTIDKELAKHLLDKGIYQDPKDAECIAKWVTSRINGTIPNLGVLNKNQFRMPTDTLFDKPFSEVAGEKLQLALAKSQKTLGITPEVRVLYDALAKAELDAGQLIFISEDGKVSRDTTVAGVQYTKVSIQVLQTPLSLDTMTVKSKYPVLSRTSIGTRIAEKLLASQKRSRKNQVGVPNVLVRVRDHSVSQSGADLGYLMTDKSGQAIVYLPSNGYYSFLPVREGFEYGSSKGTRRGALGPGEAKYTFNQKKHTIRPIDSQTFNRIKEDNVLAVRSPEDYKNALFFYPCIFFMAWWLLFFFFVWFDRKKKTQTDFIIPLALMTLSGIGLLAMFSIVNPLTDTLLGSTMTFGTLAGIIVLALVSGVDWGFFYAIGIKGKKGIVQFDFVLQGIRWISRPFMEKVQSFKIGRDAGAWQKTGYFVKLFFAVLLIPLELLFRFFHWLVSSLDRGVKKLTLAVVKKPGERTKLWARTPFNGTAPKGFGYIIIVLFFILLLQLFGDGPEGSGTKVNLFFFQPSELNKYLVVVFMAAFFAVRADRITLFSGVADSLHLRLQLKTVFWILLSLAVLLALYIVVMSDMGPALVLIVSFIFLYSIARKDFKQLLIGIATFVGMVWLGGAINGGSLVTKFLFALGWLIGWVLFWFVKEKRLYESAIFFNFLLSAFIFLGNVLAGSSSDTLRNAGQRIVDRNEVVGSHLWDNSVHGGGDQVVQGIWSLASGGFSGQGLGKGNPNLVPAFHTDMIFTSIGEEMGWITLLLIILCLAVIIHRSLVIAYQSGDRFLFFLASGIAIVTGVQFFVIILGSIGIIPLTGVAVPFLSFGMTSMIINLAVFGIVISVSRKNVTENQREINRPYRHVTAIGIGSFLAVSLILVVILFQYQVLPITRNKYLVKPAFVANNDGERLVEYNPRISLLLKEMNAGDIKDRNGLLLATSSKDTYSAFIDYTDGSVAGDKTLYGHLKDHLTRERYREHARYYPFGEHLFFVLGDYNTKVLWGINYDNPYGYLAEERFLGELRGFSTAKEKIELSSEKYSPSPFASPKDTAFTPNLYDYSPLLSYLKDGIHGSRVRDYNTKTEKGERDIYLTIDARLQTLLQTEMASYLDAVMKTHPKLRASVVILDAEKGDLLTSANYPLPNQDTIYKYQDLRQDYSAYEREWGNPVYTDRDLGVTYLTPPGSTAKVMSAMAGFKKLGDKLDEVKYHIDGEETVEGASKEPNSSLSSPNLASFYPDKNWKSRSWISTPDNCSHKGMKDYQLVHLEEAIVWSSNNYFINLVHNKQLYGELGGLYKAVGARVGNDVSKKSYKSYFFNQDEFTDSQTTDFENCVDFVSNRAINTYQNLMNRHDEGVYGSMNQGDLMWAWGQGTLDASPLTMARVASIVYNDGNMPVTKYVYATGANKQLLTQSKQVPVISKGQADLLKKYMTEETGKHRSITTTKHPGLPMSMGGKTGTPERAVRFHGTKKGMNVNDGWYICFVDCDYRTSKQDTVRMPLAIAVRLERVSATGKSSVDKSGSGFAVSFVEKAVLPALNASNYITK